MTFILTSDVDFVSDDFLDIAYRPLKELPLTIFMTGRSEYLDKAVCENTWWETEPHPNFCAQSTHGGSISEVFSTIEQFYGDAVGFRCHKYYSSNDIEEKFANRGFSYASNICTDLVSIAPFWDRCGILQIPIFFEDGGYLKYHGVPRLDDILKRMHRDAVYVFNFHPIHLVLNSCDFSTIRRLKDSMSATRYSMLSAEDARMLRNNAYGVADFLGELISYANKNNIEFLNLKQYYEKQKANRI